MSLTLLGVGKHTAAAAANIQHVQSPAGENVGTVTSDTIAFGSNTTAGSLLIACGRVGGNPTITITDTQGNSYADAIKASYTDTTTAFIIYAMNTVGGANTLTCTLGSSASLRWSIHEYSGIATSSALDQTASGLNESGSSTALATSSMSTTTANQLIFACGTSAGDRAHSAGTNFTERADTVRHIGEDRIVSSAGSYTATSTIDSANNWLIVAATFKAA